jgi:hypothetical protein
MFKKMSYLKDLKTRIIREVPMQRHAEKTEKIQVSDRVLQSENGLQNLVDYYQKLFDTKENVDHYSPIDYQNAKRSFVKYLLETRAI